MRTSVMLSAFVVAALVGSASSALAVTITLGGVEIPGQGLFSLETVDFTETFDQGGTCGLTPGSPLDFDGASADPAVVASYLSDPTPGGHPGAIVRGSVAGRHKAPASDASCYLAATDTWLSYANDFDVEYVGFHWSSIDDYNRLGLMEVFFAGWTTGAEMWSAFGITPFGDQYVNINFGNEGCWSGLLFNSLGNWAIEIDNVSIRRRKVAVCGPSGIATADAAALAVAEVPAPGALALFGLGAMVLAARQRRGI